MAFTELNQKRAECKRGVVTELWAEVYTDGDPFGGDMADSWSPRSRRQKDAQRIIHMA